MSEQQSTRILIVDDTPANLETLSEILLQEQFEIFLAPSGERALELLKAHHIDLVLLDILMPQMDGFEVCKTLKADPLRAEIPIIFLTALPNAEKKVEAFEHGAVDYIVKPFLAKEVVARVRHHLEVCSMHRALAEKNATLEDKNQQLEEALRHNDQMLRIVAHDIKNPLNVIVSAVNMLPQSSAISYALKASYQIDQMINKLLLSDRVSSGAINIDKQTVDLGELLHGRLQVHQRQAKAKNQKVKLHMDPACLVEVDPHLFCEVIDNLINNAVKFSPQNSAITIDLVGVNRSILLSVADEGPGFKDEDFEMAFKRFCRLSAKPTGNEPSTGLGLSIVKSLVEMHSGSIWVENNHGPGCTFFVKLTRLEGCPSFMRPN